MFVVHFQHKGQWFEFVPVRKLSDRDKVNVVLNDGQGHLSAHLGSFEVVSINGSNGHGDNHKDSNGHEALVAHLNPTSHGLEDGMSVIAHSVMHPESH